MQQQGYPQQGYPQQGYPQQQQQMPQQGYYTNYAAPAPMPTPTQGGSFKGAPQQQGGGPNVSKFEKFLLGTSLAIPFIGILAVGLGATTYPLVYKVDIAILSIIGIIFTVWNVANNFIIGYLQDKEVINMCFSKQRWGRRAPWVLIHTPVSSLLIFGAWYPPNVDPDFLLIWAGIILFFAQWTFSAIFIAALAATTEIMPFKEDRVEVDLYTAVWGGAYLVPFLLGAAYILAQSEDESGVVICSNDDEDGESIEEFNLEISEKAKKASFLPAIVVAGAFNLILLSIKPMCKAQMVSNADDVGSGFAELKDLERNDAFAALMTYSVADSIAYSIEPGFMLYYFTYVTGMNSVDRSYWFVAIPFIGAFSTIMIGVLWVHLFSKKAMNPTKFVLYGLVLDSILRPIAYQVSSSVEMFLVMYVIGAIIKSPRVYWDTSVRGWLVDEDCQLNPGKRREGIIVGFRSTVRVLANIAVQMLFIGMVVAGIDTTLPDACPQKAFGITYIKLMFQVMLPLVQIYQCGLINNFPLKGARLAKIIENQKDLTDGEYATKTFQNVLETTEHEMETGGIGMFPGLK